MTATLICTLFRMIIADEQHNPGAFVKLSDVIDGGWKNGFASDAKWVGKNLIWKDFYGNVLKKSSPNEVPEILLSNKTLVISHTVYQLHLHK